MRIAFLTNQSLESPNPFWNRVRPLALALAEGNGRSGEVHVLSTATGSSNLETPGAHVEFTQLNRLGDAAAELLEATPDRLLIDLDAEEFADEWRIMREISQLLAAVPHFEGESLGYFVSSRLLLSRQRRWTGLRIRFHAAMLRRILARAGRAFVFSSLVKERLSREIEADRIRVLPSGSGIRAAAISKGIARKRLGLEEASSAAVVGVIGEWKDLEPRLLAAAGSEVLRLIPGSRVLYLGPDGGKVRQSIPMCPMLDAGTLSGEEVAMHLRAMDFVVLPYRDGCTLAQSELAACLLHGLPVVSNGLSDGFGRDLESLPRGLTITEWQDLGTFLEGIEKVCECHNEEGSDSFSEELIRYHDRHFSWEVIAEELLSDWGSEASGQDDAPGFGMTPETGEA